MLQVSARPATYPLWHPMTDMDAYLGDPAVIVRGKGSRVWDAHGREYLAATSALWNVSCGFDHPEILAAIEEQLHRIPYATLFRFGNEPALLLAQRLLTLLPDGFERVFLSSSGSAAVEAALKVVRRYFRLLGRPEKRRVVCLSHSYHGTSMGAMSVTGEDLEQDEYCVDRRDVRIVATPVRGAEDDAASELLVLAEREGDELAAVIVEPILGSAGVIVPPQSWYDTLRTVCAEHGILLIVDEVATGFGRTGRMFGADWFGLDPDVMVFSKGINSGYVPLGATAFRCEIVDAFRRSRAVFAHGETQAGNPLACAAGLATLDVMEHEGLVDNAASVGAHLIEQLRALGRHDCVREVRGRGLMIGVELAGVDGRPIELHEVMLVVKLVAREGVIVHPAPSGISLFPPLVLTYDDADEIALALDRVLGTLVL